MVFSLNILLKATLLLSFGILILQFLRKKAATLRYFICTMLLLGIIILPLLHSHVPKWTFTLDENDFPIAENLFPHAPPSSETQATQILADSFVPIWEGEKLDTTPGYKAENSPEKLPIWQTLSHSLILQFIWIGVFLILFARFMNSFFRVYRISRRASSFSHPELQGILQTSPIPDSLFQNVSILSSDCIKTPMTWGAFRPIILLPSSAVEWSEEELEIALLHEFAHIVRKDYVFHLLAIGVSFVYWFHPLVWWLRNIQIQEREKACDEWVLSQGISPTLYAEKLLAIAQRISRRKPLLATPMAQYADMRRRIVGILNFQTTSRKLGLFQRICSLIIGVCVLIGLLAFSPNLSQTHIREAEELFSKPKELVISERQPTESDSTFQEKHLVFTPYVSREVNPIEIPKENQFAFTPILGKPLDLVQFSSFMEPTGMDSSRFHIDIRKKSPITTPKVPKKARRKFSKFLKKEFSLISTGSAFVEGKEREVKRFYIAKAELSNREYRKFLFDLTRKNRIKKLNQVRIHSDKWGSFEFGELNFMKESYHSSKYFNDYPVTNISHVAALEYCEWLTGFFEEEYGAAFPEGAHFRLPTLAEWTRAARGDSHSPNLYPNNPNLRNGDGCGLVNIGEIKWIDDNTPEHINVEYGSFFFDNFTWVAPVYTYLPNINGVYNLVGNVSEMLMDFPRKAIGGNWTSKVEEATLESMMEFSNPSPLVGVRLVLVVPE